MVRLLVLIVLLAAAALLWRVWRTWLRARHQGNIAAATAEFVRGRAVLEEDFRAAANVTGKPRGLRWKKCEFQHGLTLARDRASGELIGLVPATIGFEAVAGGGMEEVEAVGNLRAATAVFTWTGSDWITAGRAVFNLEPREVLERYSDRLEHVVAT